MKIKAIALAAAALATGSTAHAASKTLSVKGNVVPAACTLTLGADEVDFGEVNAEKLNASTPTNLGSETVDLTVSCLSGKTFALLVTDDRAATVAAAAAGVAKAGSTADQAYGLGSTTKGNIGAYVISLASGRAGTDATTFIQSDDKATWSDTSTLLPGKYTAWKGTAASPVAAARATAKLTIDAAVVGTDSLDLSQEVALDGRATIELQYL